MDFKHIEITNFRNYSHEELDLEDSRVWILRGRNSAGKSTLACDALTYALFGKIKAMDEPADLRAKKDDIIKRGKKQAQVKIKFTHNGERYSLTRIRKKTKGGSSETVTLYQGENKILGDEKMTSANKWIEEKLWTYNDFINTTLILQDDMTKSLQMARGERKDYLERLFNIKNFEVMSERAREKSKQLNNKIQTITGGIGVDEDKLENEEQLRQTKKQLTQSLKDKEKQLQEVSSELTIVEKFKKELQAIQNEYNVLLESKENMHTGIEKQERGINRLEVEASSIDELLKRKDEVEGEEKKIVEIEEKLKHFSILKDKLTELGEKKVKWEKAINNSLQQLIAQRTRVTEQITDNSAQLKRLIKEQSELQEMQQNVAELEIKVARLHQIKLDYESLKENKKKWEDYTKLHTEKKSKLENKLEARKKEIETNEQSILELKAIETLLNQKKGSKQDLKRTEKEKIGIIEEMNNLDSQINATQSKIEVKNTEISYETQKIEELRQEVRVVNELKGECPRCKQELSDQHTKTVTNQINKEIVDCEGRISIHHSEHDILKDEMSEMLQMRSTLVKREVELVDLINDLRRAADGIDGTQKELDSLKTIKEKLESFNNEGGYASLFPELRKDLGDLEQKINTYQVTPEIYNSLEEEYIQLQKDQIKLDQNEKTMKKLPEVDALIGSRSKKHAREKEILTELSQKIDTHAFALDERNEVESITGEMKQITDQLEEEISFHEKLVELNPEEIRTQLKLIKDSELRKIKLDVELKEKKNHRDEEKASLIEVITTLESEKFNELKQRITANTEELAAISKKHDIIMEGKIRAEQELITHTQKIEDQQNLRDSIESRIQDIGEIQSQQDLFNELAQIFKQIGGRILSRLRSQINLETIEILGLLGNPQLYGITLEDDYGLSIQTPEGDENPGFFSGGQKVRIGLAFRLALSQVLATYQGNELDTLIIDEGGFGALDEDGQDGVIDVFSAIQERFQRMIIISHIDSIAENLPGTSLHIENGSIVHEVS
ncbi:MAG: hypothetical protein ACXAB7_14215 [Candidatus Kariarchaeaceae archaeon]